MPLKMTRVLTDLGEQGCGDCQCVRNPLSTGKTTDSFPDPEPVSTLAPPTLSAHPADAWDRSF